MRSDVFNDLQDQLTTNPRSLQGRLQCNGSKQKNRGLCVPVIHELISKLNFFPRIFFLILSFRILTNI